MWSFLKEYFQPAFFKTLLQDMLVEILFWVHFAFNFVKHPRGSYHYFDQRTPFSWATSPVEHSAENNCRKYSAPKWVPPNPRKLAVVSSFLFFKYWSLILSLSSGRVPRIACQSCYQCSSFETLLVITWTEDEAHDSDTLTSNDHCILERLVVLSLGVLSPHFMTLVHFLGGVCVCMCVSFFYPDNS